MARTARKSAGSIEQLQLQVDRIERGGSPPAAVPPAVPAPMPMPASLPIVAECDRAPAEPFGRWLLAQKHRGDWIDQLADAARRDPGFPKNGTPDQVRARMQLHGGDGDAFEQIEDAERCWESL